MAETKNAPATTAASGSKSSNSFGTNLIIVLACLAIGIAIYMGVLGNPSNFSDAAKETSKNLLGTMYHGGFLVPILIGTFLIMLVFTIERAITVFRSRGKMANGEFIRSVTASLRSNNMQQAMALCDKQSGSVGNVMKSGLKKYQEMINTPGMNQDQKLAIIQKEVEEATALELPMLEKNLVFLSTIASVATLLGLLGTVSGMIKSFQAMGASGAADSSKLAAGISEALVNTALGIGTSMIAIIAYNFFTTIIDNITNGIDESGFTLSQSFKTSTTA
jgi:biopolymer transport protein ExbB